MEANAQQQSEVRQRPSVGAPGKRRDDEGEITLGEVMEHFGFGWFQMKMFICVGLLILADGMEMLAIGFISRPLEKQWSISKVDMGYVGATVFLGMMIGSTLGGGIADKTGRRGLLLASSALLAIFGMASAFSPNVYVLGTLRGTMGIAVGAAIPSGVGICTEFCPPRRRGFYIVLFSTFFSVGEAAVSGLAAITLKNDMDGNGWRLLLGWAAVPAFLVWPMAFFMLPESPHYLLITGQREELRTLLAQIARDNSITDYTSYLDPAIHKEDDVRGAYTLLFSPGLRWITIPNFISWFTMSYVFYGSSFVIPNVKENAPLSDAYVTTAMASLFEIPACLLGAFLIEMSLGRRGTLIGFMCGSGIAFFAAGFMKGDKNDSETTEFRVMFVLGRCMVAAAYTIIYPYTAEMFPTNVRITGVGAGSACSRIGGITTPIVSQGLVKVGFSYPFEAFGALSLIGALMCFICKKETRGEDLPESLSQATVPPPMSKGTGKREDSRGKDIYVPLAGDAEA